MMILYYCLITKVDWFQAIVRYFPGWVVTPAVQASRREGGRRVGRGAHRVEAEEWGGGVEAAMAAGKPACLRPLDARARGALLRLRLARASSRTAAGREGEQGRRRSGCWAEEEGVGGERDRGRRNGC
jgi:hypothetical protein